MKLCALACEVFARECSRAAAYSPHVVYLSFLPFGLHDKPDDLRARLQEEIDRASDGRFEYIVLAYGLCSRGTADLVARDTPIVIPRAHDCITLLLGSRERYQEEFGGHPGTYYFSSGWIERKEGDIVQGMYDPAGSGRASVPASPGSGRASVLATQDRMLIERFKQYVDKYGEENAEYLIEQERQWLAHYDRAALIDTGLGDVESYREFTRRLADERGWAYEELPGDIRLLERLLSADWDDFEFLLVPPGARTIEQVNSGIISAL